MERMMRTIAIDEYKRFSTTSTRKNDVTSVIVLFGNTIETISAILLYAICSRCDSNKNVISIKNKSRCNCTKVETQNYQKYYDTRSILGDFIKRVSYIS